MVMVSCESEVANNGGKEGRKERSLDLYSNRLTARIKERRADICTEASRHAYQRCGGRKSGMAWSENRGILLLVHCHGWRGGENSEGRIAICRSRSRVWVSEQRERERERARK